MAARPSGYPPGRQDEPKALRDRQLAYYGRIVAKVGELMKGLVPVPDGHASVYSVSRNRRALTHAAEYADTSVFNLSSIVILAESTGQGGTMRRMLLTGDARGDHILEGLEAAKLLKDRKCHVDLLKLPHHGSNRNLERDFFKSVTADHYVVSSNGERFDNPDQDTLEWLAEARKGTGPFKVYLTYPVKEFKFKKCTTIQKELTAFIAAGNKSGAYSVVCREPKSPSVQVELGDPLSD